MHCTQIWIAFIIVSWLWIMVFHRISQSTSADSKQLLYYIV